MNSNYGYDIGLQKFWVNPPRGAKCVQLNVITAIETRYPLIGTTTTGLMFMNPVNNQMTINYIKTLGKYQMEKFANENTMTVNLPFDNYGNIYYRQLNLFPHGSPNRTYAATVVTVVGWYY
jgi:hypothetical protein